MTSSKILSDGPHDTVVGVPHLAMFSIALSLVTPPLVWLVERFVARAAKPRASS